jgi:hypothetical protein
VFFLFLGCVTAPVGFGRIRQSFGAVADKVSADEKRSRLKLLSRACDGVLSWHAIQSNCESAGGIAEHGPLQGQVLRSESQFGMMAFIASRLATVAQSKLPTLHHLAAGRGHVEAR